jgi:serine/threonine protein kinase
VVSDFGLSFYWADGPSTTTWTTSPGNSPRYCAPEIYEHQPRNSYSDIWSLGCVFLEMLTYLKGESIDSLQRFIGTYDEVLPHNDHDFGQNALPYHQKPKAIEAWINKLKAQPRDSEPIKWVVQMLSHNKADRPTAARLTLLTGNDGKNRWQYCGQCCLDDTDDESEDLQLPQISADSRNNVRISQQCL